MAVELDGKSYVVETPLNNAYSILKTINDTLRENDIKIGDTLVQFQINLMSPMWLLCLGIGALATFLQKLMYATGCAFSIPDCSDQQVLNLAQIAKLHRKEGSYSTINALVKATSDGPCVITTDLECTVRYEDRDYTFRPAYAEEIAADESVKIVLVCDEIGPVYAGEDAVTQFTTVPVNFDSMTSEPALPGTYEETIPQLRNRLQNNQSIIPYEAAMEAISSLTGVVKCKMWFNPGYSASASVAGYTVPARHVLLIVQGQSDKIAETYLSYMLAETTNDTNVAEAEVQTYTFQNGQTFPVYYYPPTAVPVHVRVWVTGAQVDSATNEAIKKAIVALSNTKDIGENYTEAYILDSINPNSQFPTIIGCDISTDGTNWYKTTTFTMAQLGVILAANVSVEVNA